MSYYLKQPCIKVYLLLELLTPDSQRVQFVNRLVLVGPLQVKLDLSDQWEAVGVCYVQFLHFIYAIFLQKHRTMC